MFLSLSRTDAEASVDFYLDLLKILNFGNLKSDFSIGAFLNFLLLKLMYYKAKFILSFGPNRRVEGSYIVLTWNHSCTLIDGAEIQLIN